MASQLTRDIEKWELHRRIRNDKNAIYWVIEDEARTREFILSTPLRHLHPTDSEKTLILRFPMISSPPTCTYLLDKIIAVDNAVAFEHVLKRFGIGVPKRRCEHLLHKVVFAGSTRILAKLVAMGVDLTQGDHLALRLAQKKKDDALETFLRQHRADDGLSRTLHKFSRLGI